MSALTGWQLSARREEIEASAATILGRLLFEYSRLDMNLGLCLAWSGGGKQLNTLTEKVQELTLYKKLEFLEQLVDQSFAQGSRKYKAWSDWLERAHATRTIRNQIIHGRWGIDASHEQVVNVIGLPTSPGQFEVRYSIQELSNLLEEVASLQQRLGQIRDQWPV